MTFATHHYGPYESNDACREDIPRVHEDVVRNAGDEGKTISVFGGVCHEAP